MTDLTEMWNEIARYQPYADRRGFGNEWRRMTTKRTKETAFTASDAAAGQAEDAAAWAADSAGVAVCDAPKAEENSSANWAQRAINFIREAIGHNEAALREQLRLANIDALNEAAENDSLGRENERLRDELRQSSIDHTRAEVERLREEIAALREERRKDMAEIYSLREAEESLREENERLREALEIIAGDRPCIDSLMGNRDIAIAALRREDV